MLPIALLLACGAADPAGVYRQGGEWVVSVSTIEAPKGRKILPGSSKTKCLPTLGWDAYPEVGQVTQYHPGTICKLAEISAKGEPPRRVEICEGLSGRLRITTTGAYSPAKYSLIITTESAENAEFRLVVREDGERNGPCPATPPTPPSRPDGL